MITIKQIKRDEYILKNIHPIKLFLSIFFGLLILLILSNSIGIVLYNSDRVGSYIVGDYYNKGVIFYISPYLELELYFVNLAIVIGSLIVISIFYSAFKYYLRYKLDNL
jgi:hypothetical protein